MPLTRKGRCLFSFSFNSLSFLVFI
jgi:hypothetical protein